MQRWARFVVLITISGIVLGACRPETPSPGPTIQPTASDPVATSPSGVPTPAASASAPVPTRAVSWTMLPSASDGPTRREGHSWTVDPSSAVAYLFGGLGVDGFLGDLWAFDMTADAWEQLAPVGPTPSSRAGHVGVWMDGIGLVVFAGRDAAGPSSELWAYDPGANGWRILATTEDGPAARTDACGAIGPDGRLWVSHGEGGEGAYLDDVWVFDPAASVWAETDAAGVGPSPRAGSACWWSSTDGLMLYGGRSSTDEVLGDAWALDSRSATGWVPGPEFPPPGRAFAASATSSSAAYLLGGAGRGDALLGELLAHDLSSRTTERLAAGSEAPDPRSDAALVDDPEGERVLLFGGRDAAGPTDALWSVSPP